MNTASVVLDLPFDNSYVRLPEKFYLRQRPNTPPAPRLIRFNHELATDMGLDALAGEPDCALRLLCGLELPNRAEPIAMAYAGHQFGSYVPQLGDGRAVLLGEVVGPDGIRRDIHLKGAGRTPFARGGDGRAALGPVLREYLLSEAMHALGIPTTRSLLAALTGELVPRERPYPGAILARVARSHVRIGTFQYFAAQRDRAAVQRLADYVIERHYPQAGGSDRPYDALFHAVMLAQAGLVARWMQVGFIHGVMNTDNMQIAGETIDYGPCAFMDWYHPATVYSSIDHRGRYAYANQPHIAQWNLAWLLRALLPLMDEREEAAVERAQALIDEFPQLYERAWLEGMRAKLGLATSADGDRELAEEFLGLLAAQHVDFTQAFRALSQIRRTDPKSQSELRALFSDAAAAEPWIDGWLRRLEAENSVDSARLKAMNSTNPSVIPRNHLVEEAIAAALEEDLSAFEQLLQAVLHPFEQRPPGDRYGLPPEPHEVVQQTFCGT